MRVTSASNSAEPNSKPSARIEEGQSRSGPSDDASNRSLEPDSLRFRPITILASGAIIAFLFFARDVFIPLALAMLLSFLLAIPCSFLERRGCKRGLAVGIVVIGALSIVVGASWLLSAQIFDLAKRLPQYHEVIEDKVKAFRASPRGTVGQFSEMLRKTEESLQAPDTNAVPGEKAAGKSASATSSAPQAIPVEVRPPRMTSWGILGQMAGPILRPVTTAFLVLVLLIFMLYQREDLRNRFIRLAGTERIDLTTDALDEAANRVSRYMLMQLLVNLCFGLLIGIGLYFIGVPNPELWGVLAVFLRFIPYVGAWISAAGPLTLAFALYPGWGKVAWTVGLYGSVELVMFNVVEPLLYGASTGVSPMALLMAAIFWTWLWGPIGLLLSTPLTVCLAVMGLHAPRLRFLHVVLGDEPVLTPETRFYQRLLAMDRAEAEQIVEDFRAGKKADAVYQDLILPALRYAREDLSRGRLIPEKEKFVVERILESVEELSEEENSDGAKEAQVSSHEPVSAKPCVALMPVRDAINQAAAAMLNELLARRGINALTLPATVLAADRLAGVESHDIKVFCLSVVPPTNLRRTRYLCKKLRARFPETKLVIGLWGAPQQVEEARRILAEPAPECVTCSLEEALATITALAIVARPSETPPRASEDQKRQPEPAVV